MKRSLTILAAAIAAVTFVSCEGENAADMKNPPVITWESNPDFATVNIDENLTADLTIKAEAGIKALVVEVESEQLEAILTGLELGTVLDLVNDEKVIQMLSLASNGELPTGQALVNATSVDFNITALVRLIPDTEEADHVFNVTVTDNDDQSAKASCVFHTVASSETETVSARLSDVDLWNNSAVLTVTGGVSSVAYREKGMQDWNELQAGEDGTYAIAPEWESAQNDAGLTILTPKEGTGIWAGNTYEFRIDGEILPEAEYTAADGDAIPNGDMSGWSVKTFDPLWGDEKVEVSYPNASGDSFWDSGNNSMTTSLCVADNGTACLTPSMTLGVAPGNLYTGDFKMDGLNGTANFGKIYAWTARPSAMKVSYKAAVGIIDGVMHDPYKGLEDRPDTARVYAVVVDWNAQHGVKSGVSAPVNVWDPAECTSLDEGAILGYAILDITQNQDEFTDKEIPFVWYDTEARPAEGHYSVVISCATSKRGDYLAGCSTNKLWVDNFAWVY